jgi:hypothetical protein
MRTIPKALERTVERDGFLHFGLANGILNLTKTAKFLRPLIESRTKKRVSISALTMALSRLKVRKRSANARLKEIKLSALNVHKDLVAVTYEKTAATMRALERAEQEERHNGAYFVTTVGTTEATLLIHAPRAMHLKKLFPTEPKAEIANLAALRAQFDEKYVLSVGMVYTLVQQLAFQNINIVEFSSTYTELALYVNQKDLKIAFDTLYDQFM